jgi:hypothetical protein
VFQIDIALKLRIANWFLFVAEENDFEEKFKEVIKTCTLPILTLTMFIPDDLMAKFKYLAELSKHSRETLPNSVNVNVLLWKNMLLIRNGSSTTKNFVPSKRRNRSEPIAGVLE